MITWVAVIGVTVPDDVIKLRCYPSYESLGELAHMITIILA